MKPLDLDAFVDDLRTFVGFRTIVCSNPGEFARADEWIHHFFAGTDADISEFDCDELTSSLIRPAGSRRPAMVGDGHIEVVHAAEPMFSLAREGSRLYGRGTADMKTQVLVMLYVLRDLLRGDDHHDFWLVLTEDEEVGSPTGLPVVLSHLADRGLVPPVAFVPDGGHDFAYVEKEKGVAQVRARASGTGGHASRPWLVDNPVETMVAFTRDLRRTWPHPSGESDWRTSAVLTQIRAGYATNQVPTECRATLDIRYTEQHTLETIRAQVNEIADHHGVAVAFPKMAHAAHYPRDAPIAQDFIDLVERVVGRPPPIVHAAGASNGRFYASRGTHVLMTNATAGGAHGRREWVDIDTVPLLYELLHRTVRLVSQRVRAGAPLTAEPGPRSSEPGSPHSAP
jgi:acetylornithine deacetylase/succinyl-diaminopimelate desuccinylase-like protein